ncbi:putative secreted protein [Bradyrhizobium japonicum]|uniref:phage tail tube protein n=1 Tax=Bradyrhizobium elkanii TaxID=29448 RepID=UPI00037C64E9|nr:phage tail tube protein [Bradyrhizobium elkanii]WAX24353.1 tail protein [Bradyrhizobium phage ppBeUSDA76-1]MCP1731270.1 putative secreted protein [Bradyrhizobium elkanii]MCS3575399.1 putative secreted protein [Bradyrhizobium elkanii]MCS3591910.1 putative secreted protein [Bradyrhizobium elkanii]MCS3621355.1 putative secreted protein [Bradyrhizobium elkanii]
MTQASTIKFGSFLVELGDGVTPTEGFSAPCGLNSRSFNRTAATNDTNVPDCDDPDAPSWLERDTVSLSAAIAGAGVVADEDFDVWNSWFESGATKNVRIRLKNRTWIGPYKCTKLNVTGQRGSRVTFDVSLDSDGETVLQS